MKGTLEIDPENKQVQRPGVINAYSGRTHTCNGRVQLMCATDTSNGYVKPTREPDTRNEENMYQAHVTDTGSGQVQPTQLTGM